MIYKHNSVLLNEISVGLNVRPGKKYIDATFGGGGHTRQILENGGLVLSLDMDEDALKNAQELYRKCKKENLIIAKGNFRDIEKIAEKYNFGKVDGVLFDLGVSSYQIDNPEKGFSYRFEEADLDMRFDKKSPVKAVDILNKAGREEIYEIISRFGEEKYSGAIADSVYRARQIKKIENVGDLLNILDNITGVKGNKGVSSRVFQALRIAVNEELANLELGLNGASSILKTGGRLAVVSYHSLEDRIVKNWMRQSIFKVLFKHPVYAGAEELRNNPRSRSAKLRIAIKN